MSKLDIKSFLCTAGIAAALAGAGSFYVGFEEGHKAGAAFQMKSFFYSICYSSYFYKAGGPVVLDELLNSPLPQNSLEAAKKTSRWALFNQAREQCNQKLGIDEEFWKRRSFNAK